MIFKTGKITAYGDPNNPAQCFRYQVQLPDEVDDDGNPVLTGWLYVMKRYATQNQDDFMYDLGETVGCELTQDYREGIICGVINTKSYKPKQTDPDIEQVTFSDGSIFSYNRKTHDYNADLRSKKGVFIINGGTNKGMLILDNSVKRWNNIENDNNNLKNIFESWAPEPMDGGASLKALLVSWFSEQLELTQASDVEDTKATH